MSRPATRVGDKDAVHDCQSPTRAEGAKTVFVNGIPWSLQGSWNTTHLINGDKPCTIPHTGFIATGSQTVKVEGRGAGRIGDAIALCGVVVATGSPNVFAGG